MQSRLRLINLDQKVFDNYVIYSKHNSKEIQKNYFTGIKNKKTQKTKIYNLHDIFKEKNKKINTAIYIEVCCGTGDFINYFAQKHKNKSFLGIDYSYPAIQRAVKSANINNLNNILFYYGNALDFFEHDFKNSFFNTIFINYPDPWPKTKHYKRRLITIEFIKHVINCLNKKANLIIVTDSKILSNHIKKVLANFKDELSCDQEKNPDTKPPFEEYNEIASVFAEKSFYEKSNSNYFSYYKK